MSHVLYSPQGNFTRFIYCCWQLKHIKPQPKHKLILTIHISKGCQSPITFTAFHILDVPIWTTVFLSALIRRNQTQIMLSPYPSNLKPWKANNPTNCSINRNTTLEPLPVHPIPKFPTFGSSSSTYGYSQHKKLKETFKVHNHWHDSTLQVSIHSRHITTHNKQNDDDFTMLLEHRFQATYWS